MKLQDRLQYLSSGGCLLFCYAYVLGIEETKVISSYESLVTLGIIEKDCYINSADRLFSFWGFSKKHVAKNLQKDGLNIARFKYGNYNHFVVCDVHDKKYKIVYNTKDNSNCVEKGYIDEWRLIYNE